jgi:RND family efflux transporter MFP subunit
MKKLVIVAVIAAAAVAGAYYGGVFGDRSSTGTTAQDGSGTQGRGGQAGQGGGFQGGGGGFQGGGGGFQGGGGGFGGGGGNARGGGRGGRSGPMTVEIATARRASIAAELTVVGNLIGETTVSVAPRAAGRLEEVAVRMGDRVARGQRIARIEDFELVQQIKQQEAAQEVSQATIRQRDADLGLAKTNLDRAKNLFERQLIARQALDDTESRYQSAQAQLDLARAQAQQSKARLDELHINLGNTIITSPVNGFISRRLVDPGASVGQNAPIVEVVDISRVRLIANVVEKDLKQLQGGDTTRVQVDAFPGETFTGRIARVSPVLDQATRTAPIEIEIANPTYRLKPGMYARVGITLDTKKDALVVPANALVDLGGRRGVFMPLSETAVFRAVQVGTEQGDIVEILGGLAEGNDVITTGAGQLRDGDRIVIAGARGGRGGRGRGGNGSGQGADSASARPEATDSNAAATARGGQRGGQLSGERTSGQGTGRTSDGRRVGGQFSGEGRQGQFGRGRAPGGSEGQRGTRGQTPTSGGGPVAQPATQP